jgi:hypothetical protein
VIFFSAMMNFRLMVAEGVFFGDDFTNLYKVLVFLDYKLEC